MRITNVISSLLHNVGSFVHPSIHPAFDFFVILSNLRPSNMRLVCRDSNEKWEKTDGRARPRSPKNDNHVEIDVDAIDSDNDGGQNENHEKSESKMTR